MAISIKLDYATTKVELGDTVEELMAVRDSQARLIADGRRSRTFTIKGSTNIKSFH